MGLYIFQSKHASYIKVGHTSHDNPWHRLDGSCGVPKGFGSVRYPSSLEGKVEIEDLTLEGWWPEITIEEERALHFLCKRLSVVGEWYPQDTKEMFYALLRATFGSTKHEAVSVPESPMMREPAIKKDSGRPARHGEPWSEREDQQLRSRGGQWWDKKEVKDFVAEDAVWRQRTPTSVRARMKKLGIIRWKNGVYHWARSLEAEEEEE
jgi:hypothetical protein